MEESAIQKATAEREKAIVRTSMIGIGANVGLALAKAIIGLLSHSIAIVLDAVNNLSDALSSVITIIGARLAGRAPDKKHPLGHGRIEYLSSMLVSALVLYAGITALVESVKKILQPETPDYSLVSLVIIALAVVVKLLLGRYVKGVGQKVNSGSLIASGTDARSDAILSASVLAAAVLYLTASINLEAWVGAVISVFIIKAGVEMMLESLDEILGSRTDRELAAEMRETITANPSVLGAFDLYLYNYGPDKNYGSVHIEISDELSARDIDLLERKLQAEVYQKHGVILTGIGIYAVSVGNDPAAQMRRRAMEAVLAHDYALQFHGFYVDMKKKLMSFDVVFSFECDREASFTELCREIQGLFPDYTIYITPDIDIS